MGKHSTQYSRMYFAVAVKRNNQFKVDIDAGTILHTIVKV